MNIEELNQEAIETEAETEAEQAEAHAQQDEPQTLEDAMFAGFDDEQPEDTEEPDGESVEDEGDEAPEDEAPADEAEKSADPTQAADDLVAPAGLSEKANERFQHLANEVRGYREKEAHWRQISDSVQEFQTLVQESCNNTEEVEQLFDYARAVKTGDFDKVEQYLHKQIMQFQALSGRDVRVDLLAHYPDIQERMEDYSLDEQSARELATARYRQEQQQQAMLAQQQAAQAQMQQQQREQYERQQQEQLRQQAIEQVSALNLKWANGDVLWSEKEPKMLEFIRNHLADKPPSQWAFALETYYNGLSQVHPVKQNVAPLRANGRGAGQGQPQTLQEAMFWGMD